VLITAIRLAGWFAVLVIVVLSVTPGQLRPDVLGEKHIEHLTAYMGTAMLLATGYPERSQSITIGILLSISSAILEVVQLGISGRSSSVADFVASSLGAWIGVAVICGLRVAVKRPHHK
jgi:VanZ family protein